MPPFLRSLLLGSLGYMLVGLIPFLGGIGGWFVLAFSAVGFIGHALRSNSNITNPTGYGLGMGFLLGTSIRLLGGIGGVIVGAVFFANGASSNDATTTGVAAASTLFGAINLPYTIFTAPLVGGLFGLLGGLIGSSLAPKALPSSRT